ncbi:MAG: hypothetical protein K2Y22_15375 [Candidatus Obscuribacterales bacterium]|nr:hypothetical protein [Candidatus Obscuribacterales bacterium]
METSLQEKLNGKTRNSDAVVCVAVIPKGGFVDNHNFPLYWISGFDGKDAGLLENLKEVLADELLEDVWTANVQDKSKWLDIWRGEGFVYFAERQFLPGVTDNLGKTVEEALKLKGIGDIRVASGHGFLFTKDAGKVDANLCRYKFFHPLTDKFVVHDVSGKEADFLDFPEVNLPEPKQVQVVCLDVSDTELMRISKDGILALNLDEMKAIAGHFQNAAVRKERKALGMPEWPTDVELEVIAQTWSEHCKHKIFGANITYTSADKEPVQIKSLYKTYIQAATKKLAEDHPSIGERLLSVFEDNAGVVRFNDKTAVCFKVETHNSPSALEPYGGALTGILGVNRDILGTGLGAKPIANTDIFCFAYPSKELADRPTMLPAETIIKGVRKGVEDGGNKSGIPTVNGAVYFHPGYRAKPLVFCGTVGIMPLNVAGKVAYEKHTQVGDVIVMAGGRVGKDGIHGATFSSEALHEDSPVSAVQIGDPFTQKRLLDFVLDARDAGLITGITDNGAGGLSSSVGEMARITGGATIDLDNVPLKYPGLADWEIVVSESQERMTISTRDFDALRKLADKHHVEVTNIGTFDKNGYFVIRRKGKPVACLNLEFLHDGCPKLELVAERITTKISESLSKEPTDLTPILQDLLAHPNVSSREQIIRQYDHEVQGGSVVKPLMGPQQQAPCDGAVIKPIYGDKLGLVVSNGLCPQLSEVDAHLMAVSAVDEAVRNAVAVGADPEQIYILDNFCWPDPVVSEKNKEGKAKLAQLVDTCVGLYEAAIAFRAPLISGKDSMKNDFDDGVVRLSIPPTLLVSAMAIMPDAEKAVTMHFKEAGDTIYLLGCAGLGISGSLYGRLQGIKSSIKAEFKPETAAGMYRVLHKLIMQSMIRSCHDISDGGLAVAIAESIIGGNCGATVSGYAIQEAAFSGSSKGQELSRMDLALFAEGPGRMLVSIAKENESAWEKQWQNVTDVFCIKLGEVTSTKELRILDSKMNNIMRVNVDKLQSSWQTALPID